MSLHAMIKALFRTIEFVVRDKVGLGSLSQCPRTADNHNHKQRTNADWNANEDFFRFTWGRFVRDEAAEMSKRYIRFDMNELTRVAAKAVGSDCCVHVEKYPDGNFSKAFLLTMQDGVQVVAKVPNPNSGQPYYNTASEVATMDFARNVLGTPVPRVYTWCSEASKSPVRAEYIIMEKVAGVQLQQLWPTMHIKDRVGVTKAIARFQKSWMSISFRSVGSLYYSGSLDKIDSLWDNMYTDKSGLEIRDPRFAIGPSTGRDFNDAGRADVTFDRGPWNSLEDYKIAVGYRELTCVEQMPHLPKSLLTLFGPGTYQPTRAKKSAALQHYLGIVKYLLPDDPSLLASHIWHCDLHSGNIFVNPENPSEVVGITDWQSTEMKPIFDHRIVPYFLDYKGPRIEGFDSAQLPDNFSELDPVEQTRVTSLHLDMALLLLYKKIVQKFNDPLYQALEFQKTTNWSLLSLPRDLLVDGEALYTWLVVQAEQDWPNFPGVRARGNPPFPFQFSPEEVAAIAKDAEDDACGIMYMSHLKESLGDLWPEDRPVEHDQYEVTKMVLADYKQQTIEQLGRNEEEKQAWARAWPFDD